MQLPPYGKNVFGQQPQSPYIKNQTAEPDTKKIISKLGENEKKHLEQMLKNYEQRAIGMLKELGQMEDKYTNDFNNPPDENDKKQFHEEYMTLRSKYKCWTGPTKAQDNISDYYYCFAAELKDSTSKAEGDKGVYSPENFLAAGIKRYLKAQTRSELQNWEPELYLLIDRNMK